MIMHRTTQTPARSTTAARAGVALLVATGLGCGLVGAAVASGEDPWVPPDDTIVEVEGDQAHGFTIHHYDGSAISPPTDSEARAECSEYDRRIKRVRCRVEVRTWYRDLARTQDAIRYARIDAAARVADAAAQAAATAADGARAGARPAG